MEAMLLVGTTAADGSMTLTQKLYHPRRLVSVKWLVGNFAAGVDATLINVGLPGAENTLGLSVGALDTTVLTLTDANANATYTANAIVDDTLRLSVTSGGAAKVGGCIAYFDDTAVAAGGGDASAANQATGNTSLASIDTKTPALGQALAASSTPVVLTAIQLAALIAPQLAAGEAHIGQVGGGIVRISNTFARPNDATPYTVGDAVNDSTSAPTLIALVGMARVAGGSGYIVGLRISTNLKSIIPAFRVRVFNANNPTLSNDNAAFQSKYADESKRVARFDLPAMLTPIDTTNSDMSSTEDDTIRIPFVCAAGSTTLWIGLETLTAFTPIALQGWAVTAKADQN